MNRPNLMSDRVQDFIDTLNAQRGRPSNRGEDADEGDEEPSRIERLRQSILEDEDGD